MQNLSDYQHPKKELSPDLRYGLLVSLFCKQRLSLVIIYKCRTGITFNQILLSFVDILIYEHIESVYLFTTSHFNKTIVFFHVYHLQQNKKNKYLFLTVQ